MFFNAFGAFLLKLVVQIRENGRPKGCLKHFGKTTKIIKIRCIYAVSGKLF